MADLAAANANAPTKASKLEIDGAAEPAVTLAPTSTLSAIEVPVSAVPGQATGLADTKLQSGAAVSTPTNTPVATATVTPNAAPTVPQANQHSSQPVPQPIDVSSAMPVAKDPQQVALEQALGSDANSDNDAATDGMRQTLVPPSPPLRAPAAGTAPQATDPNFANVANMLNQGQSVNSLNDRLQLMLANGQSSAEIQLDPPELGSLQVRVTTRNEQTSVILVAPNNVVRDALEQQLPRLRETMENAGLQLQDASVFAQTDDKSGTQPQSYADVEAGDGPVEGDTEWEEVGNNSLGRRLSTQLVDAYI